MLHRLHLQNVGPSPELEIAFKPRMNFLVGDNGLGKTFLLDVAWWALTRSWARTTARPRVDQHPPRIAYDVQGKTKPVSHTSTFDRASESWSLPKGRPIVPGMVLYAQSDGGFAVWDPARNAERERPASYVFGTREVWDGLPLDQPRKLCNGLIADWVTWQLEGGEAFDALTQLLVLLSPSQSEPLRPGASARISLADSRKHPTLDMPYDAQVPLSQASAGMRRIVALAYLLVWAWQEHKETCKLLRQPPTHQITFLIDEVEAHLHPRWQRTIVPALLGVMDVLTGEHDVQVQLLTATHAPLVLASVEPHFDTERDCVWELDLRESNVELRPLPWYRHGDANAWLVSGAFDLGAARSVEAEEAIAQAQRLFLKRAPIVSDIERVDAQLRRALGETDAFWQRWVGFLDRHNYRRA